MSTSGNRPTLQDALQSIPAVFRKRLLRTYTDLKAAYVEGRHDLSGLKAGKFCEVTLRFLQHELTGNYVPFGSKISNFASECVKLERTQKTSGPESLRIITPRAISFLYTLRNKRGIGHIGGDVDANKIDSATCVRVADWCMCEFMRIYHRLSLEEAQSLIDALSTRHMSVVWSVMGRKRILKGKLDYRSQVLLLLYQDPSEGVPIEDLFEWTEHSNKSNFRHSVICALHKKRLIEYDKDIDFALISPTGIKKVEEKILPELDK